jgi:hypothetical protein
MRLRQLVREMLMFEQAEERRKRMLVATLNIKSPSSDDEFEEIVSLIDDTNLEFIKNMLIRKNRLSRAGQSDAELQRRFDIIAARVNSTAATMAKAIMMDRPELVSQLRNWPNQQGVVTVDAPDIGGVYNVPTELNQLALVKKAGARGESIGKGEALAILMFGRQTDGAGEPDLVIDAERQYSIKYFRGRSATTNTGAYTPPNIQDSSEATSVLLVVAKRLKIYEKLSKQITRTNMRKVCASLENSLSEAIAAGHNTVGGMSTSDLRNNLDLAYKMWDNTSFSEHPVLALIGEDSLSFEVVPLSNVRLGVLRLENAPHYNYEIAAPEFAKINVKPA